MLNLQECRNAADVRALAKLTIRKAQRLRRPPTPVRIAINDQSPESFQVEVARPIVFVAAVAEQPYPTIASIIGLVGGAYGQTKLDIVSQRRDASIVLPRQIVCALAAKMTPHSLPAIGRFLGDRDHTTILHATQKIARMRAADPAFDEVMAGFEYQLGGVYPQKITRGGPWAANPGMNERLIELTTTTKMPFKRIAITICREFGVSVSADSCKGRMTTMGLKPGRRRKLGPQPMVQAA